ncbi:MAG: ORF6N domain-containing protein [Candidatus Aureabacteria bacterium]|nr:ORF6N domain-containing protein [Candidatus Auribacterota bacterium]
MGKADGSSLIASGKIESLILLMRGEKVILDADLAGLYGVPTFRFNEAVKRNRNRFPGDFVFQLTQEEVAALISQNAMSKSGRGGRRTLPYAFTEHGAVMAATVLSSPRTIEMSIFVVRAFIHLRNLLSTHKELALKLAELERKIETHDDKIRSLFEAIHEFMAPPEKPKRHIGFHAEP